MTSLSLRLFGLLWLGLMAGCGYTVGSSTAVKSVSLPVFENKTKWRMNEFDLTNAVAHELQARGVRVNEEESPWILYGELVHVGKQTLVDDELDTVLVGSFSANLRIVVKNKRTGEIFLDDTASASAPITADRGKTEDYARAEVYNRLARWVASRLEEKW